MNRPDLSGETAARRLRVGYWTAVASTAGSATGTVIGKWNLDSISPLLMNALIFTVPTVFLTAWLLPAGRWRRALAISRRGWLWLGLFTLSSWVALLAFWAGVQKMDPTLAAFLNRSEMLVAILLSMVFLKERFNRIELAGALLSIVGIIIMRMTLRVEYSTGFWLVLTGSLFFGITEFVSKIAVRYVDPTVLTYIRGAFLALGYWLVFGVRGDDFKGLNNVWIGVIALGLVGPLFARILYLRALARLDLSKVAVISQGQPVVVIIIALLALGQLPTMREVYGGIFLIAGCLVMILGRKKRPRLVDTET